MCEVKRMAENQNKTVGKKKYSQEGVYLSQLVGKKFESVYNKTYPTKDGKYNVRIKLDDGSEKMLLLNEKENEFFGKYFKKGQKLYVYKANNGYARVGIDKNSGGNPSSSSSKQKKQTTTKQDGNTRILTDTAIKTIVRNAVYKAKNDVVNGLKEQGYEPQYLNKVDDIFQDILKKI